MASSMPGVTLGIRSRSWAASVVMVQLFWSTMEHGNMAETVKQLFPLCGKTELSVAVQAFNPSTWGGGRWISMCSRPVRATERPCL